MAFGIEIRDSLGRLSINLSDRLCRIVGSTRIYIEGNSSASIAIAGASNDNTWIAYVTCYSPDTNPGTNLSFTFYNGGLNVESKQYTSAYFNIVIART